MNLKTNIGLTVTHHIKSFYPDGTLCRDYGKIKNLITDAGLDHLASYYYAEVTKYMFLGTGTTATSRQITAEQVTTNVEATVGTFSADDATNSRVIVFADGTQAIVTAYVDTANVTVDRSQSVSSQTADVLNVEQTALATQLQDDGAVDEISNTYEATGNEGSASKSSDTIFLNYIRHTKSTGTYASGATVTEVGLGPTNSADLFARLVLSTPVEIPAGGFITNTNVLTVTIDAGTKSLTNPITGVTGDATARMCVRALQETIQMGVWFSGIDANGAVNNPSDVTHIWSGEPQHTSEKRDADYPNIYFSDDVQALTEDGRSATDEYYKAATLISYVAGSFEREITATITGGDYADTDWRTLAVCTVGSTEYYDYRMLFDADETITAGNNLTVTFTKSWRRA